MSNKLITGLALVGVASMVYAGGQSAANAALSNIKVTTGTPSVDTSTSPIGANGEIYARVDLPLIVENKNPFALSADYFSGVVKYGNITLTQVSSNNGIYVGANATKTIVLDIDVPTRRVFQDAQQAMQSGNWYATLVNRILFTGTVRLSALGQSVNIPLEDIPIPIA
ncbi:MAG: LEA type 2 family protein [Aureispira sp.]